MEIKVRIISTTLLLTLICGLSLGQLNLRNELFARLKLPSPLEIFPSIPSPKTWPKPINIFEPQSRSYDDDRQEEKENLNFFGRDIANRVNAVLEDIDKITGLSNVRVNLDVNLRSNPIFGDTIKTFQDAVKPIAPGTQWCGDGNRARSISDLGYFSKADACCRTHDHCNNTILAGETKYGLKNTAHFTRSECICDEEFYNCLKKADTIVATPIGTIYFNILGPQCFRKDHPIVNCLNETGGKCSNYELDKTKEKKYQWFDLINF